MCVSRKEREREREREGKRERESREKITNQEDCSDVMQGCP
jgi:hypothetical protein